MGKLVNESAEEGDIAAVKILQQAAGLIALLVEDNVAALNLTETEPDFIIGLWGSSLLYSRIMLDACRTRLPAEVSAGHHPHTQPHGHRRRCRMGMETDKNK